MAGRSRCEHEEDIERLKTSLLQTPEQMCSHLGSPTHLHTPLHPPERVRIKQDFVLGAAPAVIHYHQRLCRRGVVGASGGVGTDGKQALSTAAGVLLQIHCCAVCLCRSEREAQAGLLNSLVAADGDRRGRRQQRRQQRPSISALPYPPLLACAQAAKGSMPQASSPLLASATGWPLLCPPHSVPRPPSTNWGCCWGVGEDGGGEGEGTGGEASSPLLAASSWLLASSSRISAGRSMLVGRVS